MKEGCVAFKSLYGYDVRISKFISVSESVYHIIEVYKKVEGGLTLFGNKKMAFEEFVEIIKDRPNNANILELMVKHGLALDMPEIKTPATPRTETYREALHNPKWLEKRKIILARDNNTCTVCGSKKNLHVHHTFYYNNVRVSPWEYPNKSLVTVCKDCHTKFHETCEVEYRKFVKKPKVKPKKKKQVKQEKDWSKTKLMKEALEAEKAISKKYKNKT